MRKRGSVKYLSRSFPPSLPPATPSPQKRGGEGEKNARRERKTTGYWLQRWQMVAWELRNEGLIRYETDRATATFPALINKSNFNRRSNSRSLTLSHPPPTPLGGPRCATGKSDQRLAPWRNYFASAGLICCFSFFFFISFFGKYDYHGTLRLLFFICAGSKDRFLEVRNKMGNCCT